MLAGSAVRAAAARAAGCSGEEIMSEVRPGEDPAYEARPDDVPARDVPPTDARTRQVLAAEIPVSEVRAGVIRASTVLPARREEIVLRTADGLALVGELARPLVREPVATLICLHPLPTEGGMMDSHVLRKASFRLPALADLAVLRFNTRGTSSDRGMSEGQFGGGWSERGDVAAAISFCVAAGLPRLWLVGWSFGTELALMWGDVPEVEGAILLSPALRRASDADLDGWARSGRPLIALVPELDDYLRPAAATERFARVPQARVIAIDRAKHLWVGEKYVRIVLDEIVRLVNPGALPLPTEWKD
jgi:alpha/beta superfamily hydrolase